MTAENAWNDLPELPDAAAMVLLNPELPELPPLGLTRYQVPPFGEFVAGLN